MQVTSIEAGVADYPAGSHYGPRVLRDWEFVWIVEGAARWQRAAEHISLATGDLVLIPPGRPDLLTWHPERRTTHGFIHFDMADPPQPARPGQPALTIRMSTDSNPTGELCRYALRLFAQPDQTGVARLRAVISLLVEISLAAQHPHRASGDELSTVLTELAAAVGRRYRHTGPCRLTLAELARESHLSPRQLSRVVAAELGVGPVRAFESVRLARAAGLLARSDLSLADVADACGYQNAFHLSRLFKAHYQVPPSHYRGLPLQEQAALDPVAGSPAEKLVALVAAAEVSAT